MSSVELGVDTRAVLLAAGLIFLWALLLGIWTYRQMATSEDGLAHPYVDTAHRAALLYSFATLLVAVFVELSGWPEAVNLVTAFAAISYFAGAIFTYTWHGWHRDTDNQIRDAVRGTHAFVWRVVVAEIGVSARCYLASSRGRPFDGAPPTARRASLMDRRTKESQPGASSAGAIVLLHGVGSSAAAWDPILPLLAGYRVLAVDLPGFGDAPPLPRGETASIPAHANAVASRLDAEGIESAHLVGNSSGGWVALELARRGKARSVVALSPAGMWRGWERTYVFASLRLAHLFARLAARKAERLARIKPLRLALWQYFAHPARLGAREAAEAIRAMGEARSFRDHTAWTSTHSPAGLDQIDCPVLIAWGTKDRLLFGRQADRFVAAIPGAELRRLPGVGHVPMVDDPGLVATTILGFVERSRLTASPDSGSSR